jgi:YD repeat-containing protein
VSDRAGDDAGPEPETAGSRSQRTETVTRQYDADGKLTSETKTTQLLFVADDKPFPDGAYL